MQSLINIIPIVLLFLVSSIFMGTPLGVAAGAVQPSYHILESHCTITPNNNSSYRASMIRTVIGTIKKVENFNSNTFCDGESDSELSYNYNFNSLLAASLVQSREKKAPGNRNEINDNFSQSIYNEEAVE